MATLKLRYNFVYVRGSTNFRYLRFVRGIITPPSGESHPAQPNSSTGWKGEYGTSQDDEPTILSGAFPTNLLAGNYKITGCSWTCQGFNNDYSTKPVLTIKNDVFTSPPITVPLRTDSGTAHTGVFTGTSDSSNMPNVNCLNKEAMKKMNFYCNNGNSYFSMNASVDASVVLTITYEYLSDVPKAYINGNQITGTFMNPSSWQTFTGNKVTLSWTAATHSEGSTITYNIYNNSSVNGTTIGKFASTTSLSYTIPKAKLKEWGKKHKSIFYIIPSTTNVSGWYTSTTPIVNFIYKGQPTMKYYDGSAWKTGEVYYYDGSSWKPAEELKTYDGSKWG